MRIEVCANSVESAINAEKAGAARIELCTELGVGGITPSYGLLQQVLEKISIPVHVLIRPRSGDFTYSEEEFEVMLKDIQFCRELGAKGIVSGALHADFRVDIEKTEKLIKATKGLKFTFHRAFDWVKDPLRSFVDLQELGVDYLLSSGQSTNAHQGLPLLTELKKKAVSCQILPGGGINKQNVLDFKKEGFEEVHLSGTTFLKTLPEPPKISMNSEKFLREDQKAHSDVRIIDEIVQILK